MSVSVIHPQSSTGLYKVKSKVIIKSPKPGLTAEKIKRNLFGKVDPADTKRFVEQQLDKIYKEKATKWSYDFKHDRPIQSEDIQWEIIVPVSPIMTLSNAHVISQRQHLDSQGTGDDNSDIESPEALLDERASRANNYREPVQEFVDDCDNFAKITKTTVISTVKRATSEIIKASFKPISSNNNEKGPRTRLSRRLSTPSPKVQETKSQTKITDFLTEKKKSLTASTTKKMPSHNNNIVPYMTRRSCSSSTSKSLSQ